MGRLRGIIRGREVEPYQPETLGAQQRNWNCSVAEAEADFGFHADYPLERGIEETVKAYLAEKAAAKAKK